MPLALAKIGMAPLPLVLLPFALEAPFPFAPFAVESPFTGDGLSSLDLSLSGRGGRNAVGEVDGVLVELAFDDDVDDEDEDVDKDAVLLVVVLVVDAAPAVVTARPPRPLEPPLRSLE